MLLIQNAYKALQGSLSTSQLCWTVSFWVKLFNKNKYWISCLNSHTHDEDKLSRLWAGCNGSAGLLLKTRTWSHLQVHSYQWYCYLGAKCAHAYRNSWRVQRPLTGMKLLPGSFRRKDILTFLTRHHVQIWVGSGPASALNCQRSRVECSSIRLIRQTSQL